MVDGVPSSAPNVDGFSYCVCYYFGGPVPRYFVTWTDGAGSRDHRLALVDVGGPEGETDIANGLSTSAVGATEGNPLASFATAWIEGRAGVPTLIARRGQIPGATAVDGPRRPDRIDLSVSPNPGAGSFVLRLALPERTRASLRIIDATGRSVVDWGSRELAAGETAIPWDARDARGTKVRPGLYFALAQVGERRFERTFVVVR
jgi:hypothetical protein